MTPPSANYNERMRSETLSSWGAADGRGVVEGAEEVRGDGGVAEPPISLINSSDWLFGPSAAVNTPVSSWDPYPPGGGGGGALSALHELHRPITHSHRCAIINLQNAIINSEFVLNLLPPSNR